MTTSTQTPTKILRLRQACDKVGIGRSSIYTLIAAGKFPKPIQLT
ncbi:MAG: helix-turn-helix transcriptional regulator, partial [Methylovulum sp.]